MTKELEIMSAAAGGGQSPRASKFLGSLKDALVAASRDDTGQGPVARPMAAAAPAPMAAAEPALPAGAEREATQRPRKDVSPSAAEAAREARGSPVDRHVELDKPPTTRVLRVPAKAADAPARTQLVRGRMQVQRGAFDTDPVVGWLVIVGGPGIGQFRPVFEGNNTLGRSPGNRIPLDFGDDAISSEEQAYIRYDSSERSFLFVPNLAKTNVVSVNDKRPTGAVALSQMDVITMGRTQLVFVPFCGPEFDWSAIVDTKD